jgi:hypothetical protein
MLGPITFETPQMMKEERAEVALAQSAKAEKKKNHKKERRDRFKAKQKSRRNG